jgi:hypothetical protein
MWPDSKWEIVGFVESIRFQNWILISVRNSRVGLQFGLQLELGISELDLNSDLFRPSFFSYKYSHVIVIQHNTTQL